MRPRTNLKPIAFVFVLLFALLAVACGPTTPQTQTTPAAEQAPSGGDITPIPPADSGAAEGYPAPTAAAAPAEAYPADGAVAVPPTVTPVSYPITEEEVYQEPRFRIDQPVSVSTTTITGQAPPDTPLAIMDITYNGALLALGRSDGDGRFSIDVSGLIEGNRIGLGIGELAPGQTVDQMAEFYFPYRGEGFMNIPNVGIFFDTAQVTP